MTDLIGMSFAIWTTFMYNLAYFVQYAFDSENSNKLFMWLVVVVTTLMLICTL